LYNRFCSIMPCNQQTLDKRSTFRLY
jgi:hypothetical protein